jgi:anti-anti-sigma factor
MKLVTETLDSATVVHLEGRMDSVTAHEVQAALSPLAEQGGLLVINGSKVSYVSSAGLRVFLVIAKAAQSKGGRMAICALQKPVEEVFVVTGSSEILPLHATLEDALS